MKKTIFIILILAGIITIGCNRAKVGISVADPENWYRGNTHTHAKYSDKNDKNDVPTIAKWYEEAGYDFLILSEHNTHLSKKQVFCHDEASDPKKFLMICGLELSKKRHITALGY